MTSGAWEPKLADIRGPLYVRLLQGLEQDIADGTIRPGVRLPPQRLLAEQLGLGLSTVTKAYAEGVRKGALTAWVGRGTFVAALGRTDSIDEVERPESLIDLAHNVPPVLATADDVAAMFDQMRGRTDLVRHLTYAPGEGSAPQRDAACDWLRRVCRLGQVDAARLYVCNGGQHALFIAFAAMTRPRDIVLCDAATFNGMKTLADHLGLHLVGVEMDDEGMVPEALAAKAARFDARMLFLMPTIQNPTARTMGMQRREAIAEIARRHRLWIVEDDPYAGLALDDLDVVPVATLVPERTFYISSLSKTVAPGLRFGMLLPPADADCVERVRRTVYATLYGPPAMGGLFAAQWITGGIADRVQGQLREEFRERLILAQNILGDAMEKPSVARSMFVWLPMTPLEAERVARRALRGGVEVTPPGAPIVDEQLISGLRVCLGAARDRITLAKGLTVLVDALGPNPERHRPGLL